MKNKEQKNTDTIKHDNQHSAENKRTYDVECDLKKVIKTEVLDL